MPAHQTATPVCHAQVTIISIAIMNIWKLFKAPHNIAIVGNVPKGLPGYVGNHFFPLVGSTGKTLGLALLVRPLSHW